jgi:hypothetical protein
MDHEGGNGQGPGEIVLPRRRRGRDLAALAGLAAALAGLWAAAFVVTARDRGVYRPAERDIQAPPPAPTIHIPRLTLREAQELLGLSGDRGAESYAGR